MQFRKTIALVRLMEEPSYHTHEDVEVIVSETGQKGVAPKPGKILPPRTILGKYPGPPEWTDRDTKDRMAKKSMYVFSHGPLRSSYPSNEELYLVWDPQPDTSEWNMYIMHYVNTSHPRLLESWDNRNCVWGLYFHSNEFVVDGSKPPQVSLYVVTIKHIHAFNDKGVRNEVLLDYHWHLAYTHALPCQDLDCVNCYEHLNEFMHVWKRYLKQKKLIP